MMISYLCGKCRAFIPYNSHQAIPIHISIPMKLAGDSHGNPMGPTWPIGISNIYSYLHQSIKTSTIILKRVKILRLTWFKERLNIAKELCLTFRSQWPPLDRRVQDIHHESDFLSFITPRHNSMPRPESSPPSRGGYSIKSQPIFTIPLPLVTKIVKLPKNPCNISIAL